MARIRDEHARSVFPRNADGSYDCPICGKHYVCSWRFYEHAKTRHGMNVRTGQPMEAPLWG